MGFPEGDYAPFGYLRNPYQRATAGWQCEGGNLRTADETLGVEWVYPTHRGPSAGAGISLVTWASGRRCVKRTDYAAISYTSRYHSANIMGFDWYVDEIAVSARYFLVDDVLCVRVTATNLGTAPRRLRLAILGRAWSGDGGVEMRADGPAVVFTTTPGGPGPAAHALAVAGPHISPATRLEPDRSAPGEVWTEHELDLRLESSQQVGLVASLARADEVPRAAEAARAALDRADRRLRDLLAEDDAFYEHCPKLVGDWPRSWREGLVYDMETTRMCVMPPGGIFTDVWPSWMVAWPRVVLAEGTLDMLRLSYADPALAQRAAQSMFRDAPAENVPCVFQDGSYNMVARDGSRCGTSPAWCLPFLNLELLYLRTLDRTWLGELYPNLARYLDWWLRYRTDERGWVVYKCTWESGEDGNPRLDPTGTGDADISRRVRPVELQATVAHAAGVLAFFARELGLAEERRHWQGVRAAYRRRTRRLFDPGAGRFRDWLIREQNFQEPWPEQQYWGVDPRRYSPLSLTPLLGGIALANQAGILEREIRLHCTAPWTSWPSWCYVLVECASAAGLYELAGETVWGVVDRVYRQNDRRTLAEYPRPTPGVAREYWPQDVREWRASDGYGWGATTANLLIRHLFGLQESRETSRWALELAPALPPALRLPGRSYGIQSIHYRGVTFDLHYAVTSHGLEAEVKFPEPRRCLVQKQSPDRRVVYATRRPAQTHTFHLTSGQQYRLELPPG